MTSTRTADAALELLGLESLAHAEPEELSQAQRKLVGIARALAAEPRLLCLDEPAAGLDTLEGQELGRRLRSVVDGGTPMLLVDHDMGLVLGISVSFGGLRAVDGVDLTVAEGQLVGLIGPNGAGKTTFIDAISAFVPYRGEVELD